MGGKYLTLLPTKFKPVTARGIRRFLRVCDSRVGQNHVLNEKMKYWLSTTGAVSQLENGAGASAVTGTAHDLSPC